MKILIISVSPYTFTKLGKLNSSLLNHLKNKGHEVASACWHLDPSYYMPDEEDNRHYYELNGNKICRLYNIEYDPVSNIKNIYSAMKDFEPSVVITIGDYFETDHIHTIKSIYPHLFKWIAVITPNCLPIERGHKDALDYIDSAIVTTLDGWKDFKSIVNVPSVYRNVGVDLNIFRCDDKTNNDFSVVLNVKNAQSSNLPSFIQALSILKAQNYSIKASIHSNINDRGDYDIQRLITDYNIEDMVELPKSFCSIQESPSDKYICDLYNKSHVYVNPSTQSSTSMGLLEAMACGCVPLMVRCGAMSDILLNLPERWQHVIESVPFIGERHQEMRIADPRSIAELIRLHFLEFKSNGLVIKRKNSIKIAQRYLRDAFVLEVDLAIGRAVGEKQSILVVDELAIRKKEGTKKNQK